MKKNLILIFACLMLTGCGMYNKYEQSTPTPSDVFGTDESIKVATGETTIAQMSWREFFTDPCYSSSSNRCWQTIPTLTPRASL